MVYRSARMASYGSTLVETFFKSENGETQSISRGTGFFTKIDDIDVLVTNWHVLTNRDPYEPRNTLSTRDSPTHIQLHLPRKSNPKHFLPTEFFPLYNKNGTPAWLEGAGGFESADLALLPGIFPDDSICPRVEDFAPSRGTLLEPGLDVCLVGFPFGRNGTNPFPIWKKAMVASEPAYAINGKLFAYLDTPGRPGMSGSPVYAIFDSILVTENAHAAVTRANAGEGSALDALAELDPKEMADPKNHTRGLEFLGVYSGSLGDQSLERLNLGRFWSSAVLEAIKKNPKIGSNPVPPAIF